MEGTEVLGFLTEGGDLYCSKDCAGARGHFAGIEVDQDEYEALVDDGRQQPVTVCPGCGAAFAVEWPEREPS